MSHLIPIDSIHSELLKPYTSCSETQLFHYYEPAHGLFIAESPKVIARAIATGYTPESVLCASDDRDAEAEELLCKLPDIPVYTAPTSQLRQMTGFSMTRGMLCAMRRKALPSVEHLCKNAKRIAVLENVVNPTNIGAIIRNAAALHMDAVLLTPSCADPLYRRAARVSMGTVFQVPWTYFPNDDHYLSLLHQLGFQTAAMALCEQTISIAEPHLQQIEKLAIILGAEGPGLLPTTIAAADYTVKIPMTEGVDSLNVAAASAIAFWQLRNSTEA